METMRSKIKFHENQHKMIIFNYIILMNSKTNVVFLSPLKNTFIMLDIIKHFTCPDIRMT